MLDLPDPLLLAILAGLIAVSGISAAGEAALFALGPARLAQMEDRGLAAARIIKDLLSFPGRLIVTLTLVADTVNILAVVLITWTVKTHVPGPGAGRFYSFLHEYPGTSGLVLSLLALLVFAQTLPKAVGVRGSGALSRALASPLALVMKAMSPLWAAVWAVAEWVLRAFGLQAEPGASNALAGEDIRELVEAGSRQGLLDVTERELLVNLLRSGDIVASEVMTSRHEIVAVPVSADEAEVRAVMKEHDLSRLPVFEGRPDHYVGVVTVNDLLRLRLGKEEGLSLREVMRPPLFSPESRRITDLFLDFKRGRVHLALVVDEFGDVAGLVTLEDVLEEILGSEIVDETDQVVDMRELARRRRSQLTKTAAPGPRTR
jgi:putative hemolysin